MKQKIEIFISVKLSKEFTAVTFIFSWFLSTLLRIINPLSWFTCKLIVKKKKKKKKKTFLEIEIFSSIDKFGR